VLTDGVHRHCSQLRELRLAWCEELSSMALETLFNTWRDVNPGGLTVVDLERCASLESQVLTSLARYTSATLQELVLNGLEKLTEEAFAELFGQECGNLAVLDVSWCRVVSDEVMALALKAAPNLKRVHVWGCHRVTECAPQRTGVKYIGRECDTL